MPITMDDFEARCRPAADDLDDRMLRYVSSWREHELAAPTRWPLVWLKLQCCGLVPQAEVEKDT